MKELFNFEDTVKKRKMIFAEIRVDRVIFYAVDLEKKKQFIIYINFFNFTNQKNVKEEGQKLNKIIEF